MDKTASVLLPTYNRLASLIMALSGLAVQEFQAYRLIIADQSDSPAAEDPVVRALMRVIEARGGAVEYHHRLAKHGIAEQRHFLLRQTGSDYVLYLDDDVLMEPWVLGKMIEVLEAERCGFVGAFGPGLSFRDDVRPDQQEIEFWEGPVQPEVVQPGSEKWRRARLHSAANTYHISRPLWRRMDRPRQVRLYKVAWVGACVLYDRQKLLEVGGFSFWRRLPRFHSGEEVLVQNLLMRRWGGCAMLPPGTYFAEVPSTVLNEQGTVDGHALDLLPEMVARYIPQGAQE